MPSPLQHVLQRPDVWRSRDRRSVSGSSGLPSGHAVLDRALHGGGWPRAALSELLVAQPGCGEVQLLLPLLARLGAQQLWQFWINPPFIPYAPALAQRGIDLRTLVIVHGEARQTLWACEQALRNSASGAVLYWPSDKLRYAEVRKLQVAAAAEQCSGFIFRSDAQIHDGRALVETSPAALRLQLFANGGDLSLKILKQRGGNSGQTITIARPAALQTAPAVRDALMPDRLDIALASPPIVKTITDSTSVSTQLAVWQ